MKKIISFIALVAGGLLAESCSDRFLEVNPQAQLTPVQLQTSAGVEAALVGAYAMLNGNLYGQASYQFNTFSGAASLWVWGDVAADNAHKGSDPGDQPDIGAIETHNPISANIDLALIWEKRFEGVVRCNNTLKLLAAATGLKSTPRAKTIEAEARFLRAHYYFDMWRIFKFVPYITDLTPDPSAVANDKDIISDIEADMLFARQNLTAAKQNNEVGRADLNAAKAYLGKIYMYQRKYALALPLLNEVIAAKADLITMDFRDNFDVTKKNGPEMVFDVQSSVQDGTNGERGNVGDILNNPYGGSLPVTCCGFFQPSFDLANAYRVDANGLPDMANIHTSYFPSSFDPNFQVPVTLAVDTRLDYTVGRQGVPYRDWGLMAGNSWIRNPGAGGPFVPYRNVTDAAQIAAHTQPGISYLSDLNIHIIRLADVYLMAAECAANTNNLTTALTLVNKVRARAARLPKKQIEVGGAMIDAAMYNVGQYTSFTDLAMANRAIQWERRLEFAMEGGHRFFDLRRWGILKQTLDAYAAYESKKLSYVRTISKEDYYYPIPQSQIDRSQGVLKQMN
ncbi:RagB/SusD family nutrient uptake outer membrane protein [Spirosoma arcticum]